MIKNRATHRYTYQGIDSSGNRIQGEILAHNLPLARAALRQRGLAVTGLRQKKSAFFSRYNTGIQSKHIALLNRQLALLVGTGMPLVSALDSIAQGTRHPRMQDLVNLIKQDLEEGSALAESLQKQPAYFNKLVCALVSLGEQAGQLDTMLRTIANYQESNEAIKRHLTKALAYPTAVSAVAILVTIGMLTCVVPQFEALFSGLGASLPPATQALIGLSSFFTHYWHAALLGILLLLYSMWQATKRLPWLAKGLDKILLQLPFLGPILRKASLARFARALALVFAAGLPLVEALQSIANATGNRLYTQAIESLGRQISTGQALHTAMAGTPWFPKNLVCMVALGEESGTLEAMLHAAATLYEEAVRTTVTVWGNLLEPLVTCLIGLLVGGLVIALYLPVFTIGSAM